MTLVNKDNGKQRQQHTKTTVTKTTVYKDNSKQTTVNTDNGKERQR